MGDPSYFRYVPPSVANIPIDWTRIPEASKKKILLYAYDWNKKVTRPLPATIGDLAQMFHASKFFGYFDPSLCTLIMDISEFGLKPDGESFGIKVGPRFYMKYLEQVWFVLFTPGERDCISGFSHDIIGKRDDSRVFEENVLDKGDKDTEDEEDKEVGDDEEDEEEVEEEEDPGAAEEVVLAQEFDVKLEEQVSRGMTCFVKVSKKLAGWQASTFEDNLQLAQYAEAVMTLPTSHPAQSALFSSIFGSRY